MTTQENARWQAGEKIASSRIFARTRSLIKAAIVSAVLWRLITLKTAERLIRATRLRGEA